MVGSMVLVVLVASAVAASDDVLPQRQHFVLLRCQLPGKTRMVLLGLKSTKEHAITYNGFINGGAPAMLGTANVASA